MSELADFLTARLDEDEAAARACAADDAATAVAMLPAATFAHVVAWGPARVLAEVDAKRRIVELNATKPGRKTTFRRRLTLQALALPYADHPDYDEGWKP